MGMPIEIEIVDSSARGVLEEAFAYLTQVDQRFSTYKDDSEISKINRGEIVLEHSSKEMQEILALAEKTKQETNGYFDIRRPDGLIDPSGIVKGWAIKHAAAIIHEAGYTNYFVNAGGDIAVSGVNAQSKEWRVGIRNPFNTAEIVKVVTPRGKGIATSGSYIRGDHIYNPHVANTKIPDIVSLTVIAADVLEADRFATAAFAMGREGVVFIEKLQEVEAYMIDERGIATMTSGFEAYTTEGDTL